MTLELLAIIFYVSLQPQMKYERSLISELNLQTQPDRANTQETKKHIYIYIFAGGSLQDPRVHVRKEQAR